MRASHHVHLSQDITKIKDIHTTRSPRVLAANKPHKKKEISYESLPQGTKNRCKKNIVPLALDTTGALKLWSTPSDESITEVWNLVFGDEYPIDEGDTECYSFVVVKTLVSASFFSSSHLVGAVAVPLPVGTRSAFVKFKFSTHLCVRGLVEQSQSYSCSCATLTSNLQIKRAISSWIHRFADTAEKALSAEFIRQGLRTQEERATFVQHLIGNAGDISDKKRPFIWESAYDDPSARREVK